MLFVVAVVQRKYYKDKHVTARKKPQLDILKTYNTKYNNES